MAPTTHKMALRPRGGSRFSKGSLITNFVLNPILLLYIVNRANPKLKGNTMKLIKMVPLLCWLLFAAGRCGISAEASHNFDKWEKDIAAFEQSDRTNPPPKGALLFIGSSTIGRWKTLAKDFPKHRVINRGFGGSEIVDSTHFAQRIIFPYDPQVV